MDGGIPCRRFGRTELQIPVLSLGGMRFQQSWQDLQEEEITQESQEKVQELLLAADEKGFHHIETARHYGTSERQLGWALEKIPYRQKYIQTKVPPNEDITAFEDELSLSFSRLRQDRIDLFAFHGLNIPEHLNQIVRKGGCLDVVRRWQRQNLIGHIGFSTHASTDLIVKTIETDIFDYVNLHWYFINQDNSPALDAALRHDLGVFIISPTDKGGHLHTPSPKLLKLCSPLHPIVFNDLFCLQDRRIHTISVGASRPQDFEKHLKALDLLEKAGDLLPKIQSKLHNAAYEALGEGWISTWLIGLPSWDKTPGQINIPILLWLHNLIEAWGMEDFAKARYGLLGKGGHWFPGENADLLDKDVTESALNEVLYESPWKNEIPRILRNLKKTVGGFSTQRLAND